MEHTPSSHGLGDVDTGVSLQLDQKDMVIRLDLFTKQSMLCGPTSKQLKSNALHVLHTIARMQHTRKLCKTYSMYFLDGKTKSRANN